MHNTTPYRSPDEPLYGTPGFASAQSVENWKRPRASSLLPVALDTHPNRRSLLNSCSTLILSSRLQRPP